MWVWTLFLLFQITLFKNISCWDLTEYGVGKNYYISNIAVYGNRAFLALPRSACQNNVSWPTFVEVPWKQDFLGYTILKIRNKILPDQTWGICEELQDVVALAMENKMPRLWILDKGNEFCAPKLVLYSVFQNAITRYVELSEVPSQLLNSLVIADFGLANSKPRYRYTVCLRLSESTPVFYLIFNGLFSNSGGLSKPTGRILCTHKFQNNQATEVDLLNRRHAVYSAFIGNAGENAILMVSLADLKFWKINVFEKNNRQMTINADFLAISKTKPVLYMSEKDTTALYNFDLKNFEETFETDTEDGSANVNVTFLGNKLGISTGLESDYKNGIIYYLVRDYAVLRWISNKPLQAEYHNVLAQSYEKLPYVSQIFTGPQYGIWALANPSSFEDCYENEISDKNKANVTENGPDLEKRVVKILKYNKYTNSIVDNSFN